MRTRPPKFDYNSNEFYNSIEKMAEKGFTDKDIAWGLVADFGENLTPQKFSEMKNEKNENGELTKRASRISEALARGRARINLAVRSQFLKMALGGKKIKTTTTRKLVLPDGTITDTEVVQEVETELAPSLQAQSVWLFNHDEEWKKATIEGKKLDVTTNGNDIKGSISVEEWIKAKNK